MPRLSASDLPNQGHKSICCFSMGRYFEGNGRETFSFRFVWRNPEDVNAGSRVVDLKIIAKYGDWDDIKEEIHGKLMDTSSTPAMKRHLGRVQPLPRTLSNLTRHFANLVAPQVARFDLVWGMIYLNLKVRNFSCVSNSTSVDRHSSPTHLRTGSNERQTY